MSPHSPAAMPWRWRRSSSSLASRRARKEQEYVAADGHVAAGGRSGAWRARPWLGGTTARPSGKSLVAPHDLKRSELGVGAQHYRARHSARLRRPASRRWRSARQWPVLWDSGGSRCCRRAPCRAWASLVRSLSRIGVALLGIAPGLGELRQNDVASISILTCLASSSGELARSPRHDQSRTKGVLIVNNGAANFGTVPCARARQGRIRAGVAPARRWCWAALIMPRSATTQMQPTPNRAATGRRPAGGGDIGGITGPHSSPAQQPAV